MEAFRGGTGLWPALAAVCDAAIDDNQSQWLVAIDAAKELGGPTRLDPRLEQEARALVERALAWHERNPGRRAIVRFPAPGSKTVLDFDITNVSLANQDGKPIGGTLTGPQDGGTLLAIIGHGINRPTEVRIAGRPAKILHNLTNESADPPFEVRVVVSTPEVTDAVTADIRLTNRAGEKIASKKFEYE
jgi:hypothetical protein